MKKEKNIEKIKKYRRTDTQKSYAEWLGVSLKTVQNWESRGAGETTMKLLKKIYDLETEINNIQ